MEHPHAGRVAIPEFRGNHFRDLIKVSSSRDIFARSFLKRNCDLVREQKKVLPFFLILLPSITKF
jgi:hypothetical protein